MIATRFLFCIAVVFGAATSFAGSATWSQMPFGSDWQNPTHWDPATIPNGPADSAMFQTSDTLTVYTSADTEVNAINFAAGANAFQITALGGRTLTLSGTGLANTSAATQTFVAASQSGTIQFLNSASAGSGVLLNSEGGSTGGGTGGRIKFFGNASAGSTNLSTHSGTEQQTTGGVTQFFHSATAGSATFSTAGPPHFGSTGPIDRPAAGRVQFFNSSTAANGSFTNTFGYAAGGSTTFADMSSAGSATFTNQGSSQTNAGGGGMTVFLNNATAANGVFANGGGSAFQSGPGLTLFSDSSTAGDATLIANTASFSGGAIRFLDASTGGTAHVQVFGNGNLEISGHTAPGVTVGSIEGTGVVYLGANNLSVGSSNSNVTFSGTVQDGGASGGTVGMLTKVGTGTLTLASANAHTGGTVVSAGELVATAQGALGPGDVSLTAPGATLTLGTGQMRARLRRVSQSATTNDYIFDAARLSVVAGSTVNLNFTGSADVVGFLFVDGVAQAAGVYGSAASGAPNQLPQFAGPGTILIINPSAVSRRPHGATNFDIPLPLTGARASEGRAPGASNSYELLVSFAMPVTFSSASVSSGTGSVGGTSGNGTSTITIDLTGVADAQRLTVTLNGANYGPATGDLPIRFAVLAGDANGDGRINVGDTNAVKAASGQFVGGPVFTATADLNGDGRINIGDTNFAKAHSGNFVP